MIINIKLRTDKENGQAILNTLEDASGDGLVLCRFNSYDRGIWCLANKRGSRDLCDIQWMKVSIEESG